MADIRINTFGPSAGQILDAAIHVAHAPKVNIVVKARVPAGRLVFGGAPYEGRRQKDYDRALSYLHEFAGRIELKPQVFLGGACDPTTWRDDTAVPMLEQAGIAYHNPQVKNWDEADAQFKAQGIAGGIMEVEAKEKLASYVLLFVFDPLTRGLASINEVVEFMSAGRQKVVLVEVYLPAGTVIGGQEVTAEEAADINLARAKLFGYAAAYHVPVFKDIKQAVQCCVDTVAKACQDYEVPEAVA